MLREKIINALLENAFVALFEYYHHCSDVASRETIRAEENAASIAIGNEYEGNGTRRSAVAEWLSRYREFIIKEYQRGND